MMSDGHPLRALVFDSNHAYAIATIESRRVGRPKATWVREVSKLAALVCGSDQSIADIFHQRANESSKVWHQLIEKYFKCREIN